MIVLRLTMTKKKPDTNASRSLTFLVSVGMVTFCFLLFEFFSDKTEILFTILHSTSNHDRETVDLTTIHFEHLVAL